jgi:hypothetical protein
MHTHTCTRTHTRTRAHTHAHTCTHALSHTHTHAHAHKYAPHAHTHTHTRTHTQVTRFVHGPEGLAQALATTEALKPGASTALDAASLEAVIAEASTPSRF